MKTKWGNANLDSNGYLRITSSKEGFHGKRLHRLIYEDYHSVTLLDGVIIHHIDGDVTNNCILNLKAMYGENHNSHHMLKNNPMKDPEVVKKSVANHPNYKGENNPRYGITYDQKLSTKILNSKSKNTKGYFRVTTHPCSSCKQGFIYSYRYYDENKKRKSIVSTKINKLKEKVLAKGLEWIEFDEGVSNET